MISWGIVGDRKQPRMRGCQDSLSHKMQLSMFWGLVLLFCFEQLNLLWVKPRVVSCFHYLAFLLFGKNAFLEAESSLWACFSRFGATTQVVQAPGGSVEGVCTPLKREQLRMAEERQRKTGVRLVLSQSQVKICLHGYFCC